MERNKFAVRLKELRESRRLTQSNLAKELKYTQTTIAKWESGDRTPKINDIVALAKFFGVTTDYLLGVEDL